MSTVNSGALQGCNFGPSPSLTCIVLYIMLSILGLQPRDKAAMLGVKTKEFFSKNLRENRV